MEKLNIKDIPYSEWAGHFKGLGLKPYTASQVYRWLYKKGATSFDEMTNISKDAREALSGRFYISWLKLMGELASSDGTRKYLFGLADGRKIESVLIPAESGRTTLCISSQVGCALGCGFCRTAQIGFIRNLTASEIVDQVLEVRRLCTSPSPFGEMVGPAPSEVEGVRGRFEVTNLVFMGMGEPLNNYENVRDAIAVMKDENGIALAKRRITLSTAGIVPGIRKMAADGLGVKLAVSLNATTDDVRRKIMPVAKSYTIDEIIEACREYNPPGSRWRTTFEYVLIDGVNDSMEDARRLAALMSRLPSKVNLIPFNPFPGCGCKKPKETVLREFNNYLINKHIQVNIRKSKGDDILAACGQLATL